MICGFVRLQTGKYLYTYAEVPHEILAQWNERQDHYIGLLKMLALLVTVTTFQQQLTGSLLLAFVDNQGALKPVLRAATKSAETEIMV